MPDHARSTNPAVQDQLDRLWALSPGADVLGLERITALLAALGDPHRAMPPVFHVAGTNGKGSTCAFLRAGLEAAGYRVHAYTSPHLVRFNERIRLAGTLIDDAALAPLLAEVLDAAEVAKISASFFEITTAAAFLAFSRTPADACVIEVGLGGRLDATNVIEAPLVTGIAQLGVDHEAFLGSDPVGIAREKAGIAKAGAPLVTMDYGAAINQAIAQTAASAGATLLRQGRDWNWYADVENRRIIVTNSPEHAVFTPTPPHPFVSSEVEKRDPGARDTFLDFARNERDKASDKANIAEGSAALPFPELAGDHQQGNFALAGAMLRAQRALSVSDEALRAAAAARWPARMQRLGDGPLTALLPDDAPVWLDGGHNEAAGAALAQAIVAANTTESGAAFPLTIVAGMLANKDPEGLLGPIAPHTDRLIAVPVEDHAHHAPYALATVARALGIRTIGVAANVPHAFRQIALDNDPRAMPPGVLICGSLYLAGQVLAANEEWPD